MIKSPVTESRCWIIADVSTVIDFGGLYSLAENGRKATVSKINNNMIKVALTGNKIMPRLIRVPEGQTNASKIVSELIIPWLETGKILGK